jgi:hypothetical protein
VGGTGHTREGGGWGDALRSRLVLVVVGSSGDGTFGVGVEGGVARREGDRGRRGTSNEIGMLRHRMALIDCQELQQGTGIGTCY